MRINYAALIKNITKYVTELFNEYHGEDLFYHNLEHTENVAKRTLEIAANYSFSEVELFIISTAAWFHDTGQLTGGQALHEERSVVIMQNFLNLKGIDNETIEKIKNCICATILLQKPKTLFEAILCDADTYSLGTEDFIKNDTLLKKENGLRKLPINNWDEKTLKLLQGHQYFTSYCRALLNKGKEKNSALIQQRLKINDKY